ncbi:MAG: glycosyltransferase family 10 [Deltaproteobacteria bacterium]|nr:glycosyltransferase family 10 [Deltaproteobacteria bacterium]
MRVGFRNFWPGFDPEHFFLPLLRGMQPALDVVVGQSGPLDLELVSVFGRDRRSPTPSLRRAVARRLASLWRATAAPTVAVCPSPHAKVSIWFTGENIRPPRGAWDLRLSFDGDSTAPANRYLPLWWLLLPELLLPSVPRASGENRLGRTLTLDELSAPRVARRHGRERFACAFIGNPEPLRMRAVRALSSIGPVDVFGSVSGRWVEAKQDVARHYRFVLCFENSVAPGYVTEKAFDAWGTGAVPLWNGLDPHGFLNPAALINYASCAGMDEFCARVARIDRDAAAWSALASQPLLLRRPSLAPIRTAIWDLLAGAGVV